MQAAIIGENAGILWNIIRDKGPISFNNLRKQSKLRDPQAYMAVGWLAREGKVAFEQKGNQIFISLKQPFA